MLPETLKEGSVKRQPLTDALSRDILQVFSHPSNISTKKVPNVAPISRKKSRKERAAQRGVPVQIRSGFLDFLPAELIRMIIHRLDFQSFARLCCTNSVFEAYIKGLESYKLIVRYCREKLRSMVQLQFFPSHGVGSVEAAFRDPRCHVCGELGTELYLPTCRRFCQKPGCPTEVAKRAEWLGAFAEVDMRGLLGPFRAIFGIWRHPPIVPFPYVDRESQELDYGRQCRACVKQERYAMWPLIDIPPSQDQQREIEEIEAAADKIYSAGALLEHIRSGGCQLAEEFWSKPHPMR